MHNVGIVIKYEILSMIRKPSFWFFTLVFPVMIMAFTFLPQVFAQQSISEAQELVQSATRGPAVPYVDLAGVITEVPTGMEGSFRAFASEASARVALESGEIAHYFLIPGDYKTSGRVVAISERVSPMTGVSGTGQLEYVLRYNLALNKDLSRRDVAAAIAAPVGGLEERNLQPATAAPVAGNTGENQEMTDFLIPFAVMFILFFVITMSAGFMLQSVTREKENRTAEILLTSLSPRDLMLGKVVGLGIVALIQMLIWLGGGQALLAGGALVAAGAAAGVLSVGFLLWAVAFFVFGYIVYAAALGALGALAPNMREGSQFTFVLLLPLLVPLWLNNIFTSHPDGALAVGLSLIPLTSPTAMVTRLAATDVPLWQPVLAIVLLIINAYVFVLLAARFFRADTLLSGASISWGRIWSQLRSRA